MSTNSGLLPQNKTLFGLNPFVKFMIAQKYVPTIQTLSLENGVYHPEEEAILNTTTPRIAVKK